MIKKLIRCLAIKSILSFLDNDDYKIISEKGLYYLDNPDEFKKDIDNGTIIWEDD